MTTKICSKCGRLLPISEFSKDSYQADGYQTKCKRCSAKAQRRSRKRMVHTQVEWKTCSCCGNRLPIYYFGLDSSKVDNHRSRCRNCEATLKNENTMKRPRNATLKLIENIITLSKHNVDTATIAKISGVTPSPVRKYRKVWEQLGRPNDPEKVRAYSVEHENRQSKIAEEPAIPDLVEVAEFIRNNAAHLALAIVNTYEKWKEEANSKTNNE